MSKQSLGNDRSVDRTAATLAQTEKVESPPIIQFPGEDEQLPLGDVPFVCDESSAVDLGSNPALNLPFTNAVKEVSGDVRLSPQRHDIEQENDSGIVDLLTASSDFDLRLQVQEQFAIHQPPGDEIALENFSLIRAVRQRAFSWAGCILIGLLTGLAASYGIGSYAAFSADAHHLDDGRIQEEGSSDASPRHPNEHIKSSDLATLIQRLTIAETAAAETFQTQRELARVNALLPKAQVDSAVFAALTSELAKAKVDAETARVYRAQVEALHAASHEAGIDPSGIAPAIQKIRAEAAKVTEAEVARLREEMKGTFADAHLAETRLREQLAQSQFAQLLLEQFCREVMRRFQLEPPDSLHDLLAVLPQIEARLPETSTAAATRRAQRQFASGWSAYRAGDFSAAEQLFAAAEASDEHDARYPYFLGLSRLAQGKAAYEADIQRGVTLEKQGLPGAAQIDRALEGVPLAARQAIGRFRR